MDENTLKTILEADSMVEFGGVYSINEIPHTLQAGYFYIFNTAPSWHPGEHWISVYSGDEIECFDPLAEKDTFQEFKALIPGLKRTNNTPVQHILSTSCGEYCLFYICMRCRGISLDCIIDFLSGWNNEQFVIEFLRDVYEL